MKFYERVFIQSIVFIKSENNRIQTHTNKRPCDNQGRRLPSRRQEERSPEDTNPNDTKIMDF